MNIRAKILFGLMLIFSGVQSLAQNKLDKVDNYDLIKSYLNDPLWEKRDVYDAGHFLMIPLHYSYVTNDEDLKLSFTIFFNRFLSEYKHSFSNNSNNIQRLQFSYLISQYLKLHLKYENCNYGELQNKLLHFLKEEVKYFWIDADANNWKYSRFIKYQFKGFKDRIDWKLNTTLLDNSNFYRVIIDSERFLIAIAADLKYISRRNIDVPNKKKDIGQIDSIVSVGFKIYKERVSLEHNEFIFQKGYWSKHRDYKYAGCETLECIEKGVNRVSAISEDTSHSLRLPLLISSLEDGMELAVDKKYFKKLKEKLAFQLLNKIIREKENNCQCFYPTNYLDGSNGYYRYNYETHKNEGYGPFELSETFKIGWWAFLEDNQISNLYTIINSNLKNNIPCEFLYKDKTKRERHPIVANRFNNNLYVIITKMASELITNTNN